MKNTPETREKLAHIVNLMNYLNTGYQIGIRGTGRSNYISQFDISEYDYITLTIRQPKDTDDAVYPEIYFSDDWYGKDAVGFEISTTGYGDHSLKQAHRVIAGLSVAATLVENLYTAFEVAGFNTRR